MPAIPIMAHPDVVETNMVCWFHSSTSTVDGDPIPVDAVINVYTQAMIHVGTFTVSTEGHWGYMAVFGDDLLRDDDPINGAVEDELLVFQIDGVVATIAAGDGTWNAWQVQDITLEVILATATPTHTPSHTPTNTATHTATHTPTNTATYTPSNTPTHTYTPSITPTPTHTHTPTATATPGVGPSPTHLISTPTGTIPTPDIGGTPTCAIVTPTGTIPTPSIPGTPTP